MSDTADTVMAERAALVLCSLDCLRRLANLDALDPVFRVDDLQQISAAADQLAAHLRQTSPTH